MSAPKKRKSDVHNDIGINDNAEHPHTKKEKPWFEENEPENRRQSIFKGLFKKMRSSSTLKTTNSASTSKLEKPHESLANETHASITSESSVTSVESNTTLPNVNKNAGLRTFVNRDSFTPVPPENQDETRLDMQMPTAGSSKHEVQSRMDDAISVNSHMSVDSTNTIDEDSISIGSASAFCTPSRNPLHRSGLRMSTRSVPEWDEQPALFRSLCNSAVRRVPTSKSEGGGAFGSTPMRRSMRTSMQKRILNSTSMEDVPEEEALTISSSSHRLDAPIAEEELFEGAKDFFAKNVQEPNDESLEDGQTSRLSTSSEARKSTGGSVGRKNSIFRKMFSGNKEAKERRMSEVFPSDIHEASMMPRGRRGSIVSFTNDCSFDVGVNQSASVTSLASNDSSKLKMRKKHPSTSNLTQRISSVFRRTSTSAFKDEESGETRSRRNTLTGFSSISSGIGSISSGMSDSAFNTTAVSGHSISRNGSKREDESKRERSRRLLDRIVISDIPAAELLKLKLEQVKRREHSAANEQFETQLNESGSSTSSQLNELLSFDVVAVDVHANGTPFSTVAATMIDEEIAKTVRSEVSYRPDRCGSITDCEPELIFVCQEPGQSIPRSANECMNTTADTNTDLLRNVRSGLCKSIEEWKKLSASRESSTMLIYPMFCQSEAEWDSKATIDAIFLMLDGILQNARRWRPNGKCVLAGLSANNTRLLKEKYEEVRQSVAMTEADNHSVASNSTIFG